MICDRECGELATVVATADGPFGDAVALLCVGHSHEAVTVEHLFLVALVEDPHPTVTPAPRVMPTGHDEPESEGSDDAQAG